MPDEQADFVAKLHQIEEVALMAGTSARDESSRSSLRHIALIARSLRGRLEMRMAQILAVMPAPAPDPDDKRPA